jgi:hypothetical protein
LWLKLIATTAIGQLISLVQILASQLVHFLMQLHDVQQNYVHLLRCQTVQYHLVQHRWH